MPQPIKPSEVHLNSDIRLTMRALLATHETNRNEPAAPPTTRRTYDFATSRYVRCADCDRWRSADIATCQCGSRRLAIINPDAPEEP